MEKIPELGVAAGLAMGWLMQQARAYKAVNNWLVWIGVGIAGCVLWFWMTPDAVTIFQASWRVGIWQVVAFAMTAGGYGKLLTDAKLAPATDSK